LPPHNAGASRLAGCNEADDPRGLWNREVEVRATHRIDGACDLGQLVGPSGVPDKNFDRLVQLGACHSAASQQPFELCAARIEHLCGAVQDLAAVHRGARGPTAECRAGCTNRVAQVLARAARHVHQAIGLIGAPGL